MKKVSDKFRRRLKRKISIRKKIKGTGKRPRISVYKSNRYCYIQVIDDEKNETIISATNLGKENKKIKKKVESIGKLGEILGKKMLDKSIKKAVFDRNGRKYHGIIKSIAEGIRKAGIVF